MCLCLTASNCWVHCGSGRASTKITLGQPPRTIAPLYDVCIFLPGVNFDSCRTHVAHVSSRLPLPADSHLDAPHVPKHACMYPIVVNPSPGVM